MCDFLCSSQGTIIATLQELSKEYIYVYMCLYLQPDSHYWVCSESPGNGYVTSMFYAQCRPRGAIMQNTSSKATYEDEYTNELINERPEMFQNCLCDTGTAISVKIFLSCCLLFMKKLINWTVYFCGFGGLSWEQAFTPISFLLSKSSILVEISNFPFFGWKDLIFPYLIDCYHFVELVRCSVSV